MIMECMVLLVIETSARYTCIVNLDYNTTLPCTSDGTLSASVDYWWMAIPFIMYSPSESVLCIGVLVYQTPYSMRGLVFRSICFMCSCGDLNRSSVKLSCSLNVQLWYMRP